jgi:hypothetical protein
MSEPIEASTDSRNGPCQVHGSLLSAMRHYQAPDPNDANDDSTQAAQTAIVVRVTSVHQVPGQGFCHVIRMQDLRTQSDIEPHPTTDLALVELAQDRMLRGATCIARGRFLYEPPLDHAPPPDPAAKKPQANFASF